MSEAKADGMQVDRVERISYWSIVWSQLTQSRLAVMGLWSIGFITAVAVFAPLISLNRPFWFFLPEGVKAPPNTCPYPFFTALFNINFFENGVDFFFNTLMLASPMFLAAWLLLKALSGARWRNRRKKLFASFVFIQVAAFLWCWTSPVRKPLVNYRKLVKSLESRGIKVSCRFPLLPYSFREIDSETIHPHAPSRAHVCGTDRAGRDVFVRMVYGTRISLTIGVVAVAIYVSIGIVLGSLAGYFGGWVDMLISRFIEIMLCFPAFFLILTLAAFIEKRSIFHIMAIIGFTRWTGVARLVRGEYLRQRNLDYVQAAIALGFSRARVIFGHILPNAVAPVLVSATFGIAGAILTESSLSFLGLGDLTAPSWGSILAAGRAEQKLWLILVPGFAIFFVVSVFNLVGEGLRDALDPKLRR